MCKRRLRKLTEDEPVNAAALAALEAEAAEYRAAIIKGHDPLAERSRSAAFTARPATIAETFKSAALDFIAENRDGWKNEKHRTQWENSLQIGRASCRERVWPYVSISGVGG